MTASKREPSKGGRPSSFKQEFVEQTLMLSRLGATDKEIASFFDVSEVTLNAWKKSHPEFLKSLKDGKLLADARVSQALYTRATGYELNEKHYPPDTTACIFWLKNRQPEKWRDKTEVVADSTSVADALKEIADKLPD
jgi:hypothetical protein